MRTCSNEYFWKLLMTSTSLVARFSPLMFARLWVGGGRGEDDGGFVVLASLWEAHGKRREGQMESASAPKTKTSPRSFSRCSNLKHNPRPNIPGHVVTLFLLDPPPLPSLSPPRSPLSTSQPFYSHRARTNTHLQVGQFERRASLGLHLGLARNYGEEEKEKEDGSKGEHAGGGRGRGEGGREK